ATFCLVAKYPPTPAAPIQAAASAAKARRFKPIENLSPYGNRHIVTQGAYPPALTLLLCKEHQIQAFSGMTRVPGLSPPGERVLLLSRPQSRPNGAVKVSWGALQELEATIARCRAAIFSLRCCYSYLSARCALSLLPARRSIRNTRG